MDIYLFDVRDHPLYNITTGKNVGHTEPKKFRKLRCLNCQGFIGFLSMVGPKTNHSNGW